MGCGGSKNAQISNQPASQPASQPKSQPASQQASAPTDTSATKSGNTNVKVSPENKRLAVGKTDELAKEASTAESESDRKLLTDLEQKSVLDMLPDGRKFSLSSAIEQKEHTLPDGRIVLEDGRIGYQEKSMKKSGDCNPTQEKLGYTCRKGLIPGSANGDSWSIVKDNSFAMYGVYDGHGNNGHDVSNFVKDNLPKLITKDSRFKAVDMPQMLEEQFAKVQSFVRIMERHTDSDKKFSSLRAGTTCSVAIHDKKQKKLTVAHVGDSIVVLGTQQHGETKATQLATSHKPEVKKERDRIEKAGGRIVFDGFANHRVYAGDGPYPGLNTSRSLGDLLGHQDAGLSHEPEVIERTLTEDDKFLLVCSHGVWEFITPEEAVKIVKKYPPEDAMKAAEGLAREAWDRWIKEEKGAVVDDITVILAHL
jgi:serine/threonine protein phosphatase PrpC